MLREKIIAQASRRNVIIVDESKLSPRLGTHCPVPVEVIPFGCYPELNYLSSIGAEVSVRKEDDGSTFETDQGNLILDCDFGPIEDAYDLALKLNERVAIVEHGLFLGIATDIIVAGDDGIRHLKRGSLGQNK